MFNLIKLAKWHCWTHLLFNFAFMWDNAKLAGHNQGLKKSISMFTFLTCLSNHLIPSTFSVARRVESSEDFSVAYFIPSIPISRKQWLREWLTQTKVIVCFFLRDFSKLRISIELISSTLIILETNQRNRRQRARGKVSWRWLKLRWSCTRLCVPSANCECACHRMYSTRQFCVKLNYASIGSIYLLRELFKALLLVMIRF